MLILEVPDWGDLTHQGRTLVHTLARAYGVELTECQRIVIGERSIWFWLLSKNRSGRYFRTYPVTNHGAYKVRTELSESDEYGALFSTGETAYRVERFDIERS